MKRLIEITLITIILLLIAFAVGCKKKVETGGITICDNCPHIGWFGEPNSCEARRKADAEVKFDDEPEPNKPQCEHKNIKDSKVSSTIYYSDGSCDWLCPDCGEFVNIKEDE